MRFHAVSVIICAHNELKNLEQLVPLLISQDHPKFEVIIVNDRSSDGSEEWLHGQETVWPDLKIVSIAKVPPGINPKKQALIKGIEVSKYDILLLTDADCPPSI